SNSRSGRASGKTGGELGVLNDGMGEELGGGNSSKIRGSGRRCWATVVD
ncbi:MAG: hypothetical protein F6K28_36050, partial [Microcoleus sp. SIO2G3]|nr:hypothetical protein [Microcoleus sp. SIO2G3]